MFSMLVFTDVTQYVFYVFVWFLIESLCVEVLQ